MILICLLLSTTASARGAQDVIPEQVVANIQAVARQTGLGKFMGIPALENGVLHARRILRVRDESPRPEYLVVELEALNGTPVARVGITVGGVIRIAEPMNGTAEGGISILRPLVQVHTEKGSLYFNSRGEVFAEVGSEIAKEFPGPPVPQRTTPGLKALQRLSSW